MKLTLIFEGLHVLNGTSKVLSTIIDEMPIWDIIINMTQLDPKKRKGLFEISETLKGRISDRLFAKYITVFILFADKKGSEYINI